MVSKETFFSSNRWFLLSGLATAVILPLLFIPKYIIVQPHITEKSTISQTVEYTTNNYSKSASLVDWNIIILSIYLIVFLILFSKLIISFFSLYKLLHRHKNIKRGLFKLVDLDDEIAPFSFFNYIVYNSNFYTEEELQSILLHEKVHSEDKHSIDTLISQLFCIVFWFNPFIWLYKKSVLQNLEYIADQKASKFLKDKTQYQKALLKVITERNCFSISNHFNSSLIKNRIIMLNQPQSEKKKTWKYALIIPVLAGFMFFFQTKTIAQEKNITQSNSSDLYITTDKNSSEQEIKEDIKIAKEKFGVVLKYSKIKRNTKGEITAIKIEYKDFEGKKGMTHIQGDDPIKPIYFHKTKNRVGFGKANEINSSKNLHKSNNENNSFGFSFLDPENDIIHESEEIISTPKNPDASNKLEKKEADKSSLKNYNKSIIIKKQNNGKPEIIINGKTIETDSEEYKKALKDFNGNFEFNMQEDGPMVLKFNNEDIFKFDSNEIEKITKDALSNSQKQFSKLREKINSMRPKMDQMKVEIEKIKPEDFNFDFNWNEKENDSEIKKAKEEMLKAREEMIKAREEMIKAKEEMLKAKNQQNKTKKA